MGNRERLVAATFVELADTLSQDYEISEFLELLVDRCGRALEVTTGGVMLESPDGPLRLAAALTQEMRDLEQAEIDHEEGPCHEAYRTGVPVGSDDLRTETRWPNVMPHMERMGLLAVYAFPLRLRDDTIGALNLYRDQIGAFDEDDISLGQAFADVAAIGILQARKVTGAEERAAQLQHALDSRVLIEQAKGIVSAAADMPMDQAFELIRGHARRHGLNIHDVAQDVVDRGADVVRG